MSSRFSQKKRIHKTPWCYMSPPRSSREKNREVDLGRSEKMIADVGQAGKDVDEK